MTSRNAILLGLVALLVVLELATSRSSRAPAAATSVLTEFSPARAASVRIEGGEEAVQLRRSETGWVVTERHDYPAHGAVVETLLGRLASLRSDDLVGTDPGSHALFGLAADDDVVRVTVRDADAAPLAQLRIGRSPEGTGSYVQRIGRDEVYRAAALDALEASPRSWLDTHLVAFDLIAVRAIHIGGSGTGASRSFTREPDGRWRLQGTDTLLPPAVVDPLLVTAANLYFQDVQGVAPEEAGLDAPRWTLRFDAGEALPISVHVGEADGSETRAVTVPGWNTPWVVRLPEASAAQLEAAIGHILQAG